MVKKEKLNINPTKKKKKKRKTSNRIKELTILFEEMLITSAYQLKYTDYINRFKKKI